MYTLKKRGKIYHVEINLSGRRLRKSTGTEVKTLAAEYAKKIHDRLYRELRVGDKPRRTWREAVTRYLTERNGKANTQSTRSILRKLSPYFQDGEMYLDEITGNYISNVLDKVQRTPTKRSPNGLANSSRNRHAEKVRAILKSAANRWEDDKGRTWLDKSPHVEMLPENNERDRWLTKREAARLVSALPLHLAEMVCFNLYTGLRDANISHMKWDWVDMDRRVVVIPGSETKTGKPIPVYLVKEAFAVLEQRISGRKEREDKGLLKEADKTYVFAYRGRKIGRMNNTGWKQAKKDSGLTDITVHDLRRTWASWHLQAGTSADELMKIGGWASVSIVLSRYAHLSPEQYKGIAENISQ